MGLDRYLVQKSSQIFVICLVNESCKLNRFRRVSLSVIEFFDFFGSVVY